MPNLSLKTIKGLLNDEQKIQLMDKFTAALIEVEGGGNPDFKKDIMISIEEIEPKYCQVGGMRPTAEMIAKFVQQREANRIK